MASLLRYCPPSARRLPSLLFRSHHTTSPLYSATPSWQELVGGREAIEKKRQLFEEKYKQKVEQKAKEKGVSIDELKEQAKLKNRASLQRISPQEKKGKSESVGAASEVKVESTTTGTAEPSPVRSTPKNNSAYQKQESPVKPLGDILDLSKAVSLPTEAIAQLWTTYHQTKGLLSAAIPTQTYERMIKTAKQYPLFVLPLARDPLPAAGSEATEETGAVEMHLLQWAFLPPPSTVLEPVPSPSTILFTPLAEYQQRQAYAQPYLILTHYTDLSLSHNLVLLRGELTDNVALNQIDAQILAVRTQLFFNWSGKGGEKEEMRKELLRVFHETPEKFDLEKLVKLAWEID